MISKVFSLYGERGVYDAEFGTNKKRTEKV